MAKEMPHAKDARPADALAPVGARRENVKR